MITNNSFDKEKIDDGNRYSIMQNYPGYMVCKAGKIIDINGNEPYYETIQNEFTGYKEEIFVTLIRIDENDNPIKDKLSLPKLILSIYYGDISLPFEYKDGDYKNCSSDNLKYIVTRDDIHMITPDEFILADQKFLCIKGSNFDEVFISEYGVVIDLYSMKIYSAFLGRWEYKRIALKFMDRTKKMTLSRLVYMVFNDDYNISSNDVIHHKDTNIWNNHYKNLEKTTQSDNVSRSFSEENSNQRFELKFPIEIVKEIKEKMANGILFQQLATEYDISHFKDLAEFGRYCTRLRTNRDFKELGLDFDFTKYNEAARAKRCILSDEEVHFICKCIEDNMTRKEILVCLNSPGITAEQIRGLIINLRSGRYHKEIASQYDFSNYDPSKNRLRYFITDEQKAEMKRLYAEGVSHVKIAKMFNVSPKYSSEVYLGRR